MSPAELAEVSRQNGKLSHGPVSDEGKSIVSRNALKHGFSSETVAIKTHERDAYSKTLDIWIADQQPTT